MTLCNYVLNLRHERPEGISVMKKEGEHWSSISRSHFFESIEQVANALLSLKVKQTDKVGIFARSSWEWALCDLAILGIRAVTVPIYSSIARSDFIYIVNDAAIEILFIENASLLKQFLTVKDQCPTVKNIILFNKKNHDSFLSTEGSFFITSFEDFLLTGNKSKKKNHHPSFAELSLSVTPQDLATIVYTSGTTGQPRGVMISHEQILSEAIDVFKYVGALPSDVSISLLPFSHILGRVELWGSIISGTTLAFAESIEQLENNLMEIQPTFIIGVPGIFEKLYNAALTQIESRNLFSPFFEKSLEIGKKVSRLKIQREPIPFSLWLTYQMAQSTLLNKIKNTFGGRLRFAICGGASLNKEIALFFHACDILLLEGYGLSESTGAITVNTPFDYQFGSVGKPFGDVQIRIASDGEILVKSKKVMMGYYHQPEESKQALSEGWLHTGDIGEFLPSGDLKIIERKKDLIKTSGGKYVSPQKLESMLKAYPLISQAFIYGENRKYIVALIVLNKIYFETHLQSSTKKQLKEEVQKLIADVNSHLAGFESIKRFHIIDKDFTVEDGELTPSMKLKRVFLEIKYQKYIETLYNK